MENKKLPHDHGMHKDNFDLLDEDKVNMMTNSMKKLSDPTRLQIFWILCHREECVINIAAIMNMSSPAISHHLKILKLSDLIESRRRGKEMFYKAKDSKISRFLFDITVKAINL